MGDGTKENPYTREDVLRLIKENGGTAKGLNLAGQVFEEGVDLSGKYSEEGINLTGAILNRAMLKRAVFDKCHLEGVRLIGANLEGAFLEETHLEEANLSGAHMENTHFVSAHLEKARLTAAHLEGAELFDAHLEEANLINTFLDKTRLSSAHLQGVYMLGTKFSANTEMASVDWGNYILGEEKEGEKEGQGHFLKWAEEIYRRLKMWYINAGVYDTGAKFYYREKEANRKALKWRSENWHHRLALELLRALFGYGERWERILIWIAVVVFGLPVAYRFGGLSLSYSIYYSVVSFTALGYGKWVDITPPSWVQALGAAESVIGVLMMALLLVTFVRKWTR